MEFCHPVKLWPWLSFHPLKVLLDQDSVLNETGRTAKFCYGLPLKIFLVLLCFVKCFDANTGNNAQYLSLLQHHKLLCLQVYCVYVVNDE